MSPPQLVKPIPIRPQDPDIQLVQANNQPGQGDHPFVLSVHPRVMGCYLGGELPRGPRLPYVLKTESHCNDRGSVRALRADALQMVERLSEDVEAVYRCPVGNAIKVESVRACDDPLLSIGLSAQAETEEQHGHYGHWRC